MQIKRKDREEEDLIAGIEDLDHTDVLFCSRTLLRRLRRSTILMALITDVLYAADPVSQSEPKR